MTETIVMVDGQITDAEPIEHMCDLAALLGRRPRPQALMGAGHEHTFKNRDGEVPVHGLELGYVCHAQIRIRGPRATAGLDESEQDPQKGGFTRSRRTDDTGEVGGINGQGDVMEDVHSPIACRDVRQRDEGSHVTEDSRQCPER